MANAKPMDLDTARKVFEQSDIDLVKRDHRYKESKRYYHNRNDIVLKSKKQKSEADEQTDKPDNPLRMHDSRVSSNFLQLLIDQKAAFGVSRPPMIDTGNDALNKQVLEVLGDDWNKTLFRIAVDASLAGVGWIHCWHGPNNEFKYAIVPPNEVTPIYKSTLDDELQAVRRTYEQLDPSDGKVYIFDEYWTQDQATFFKREQGQTYSTMIYDQRIGVTDSVNAEAMDNTATINHGFNGIPFIPFNNKSDKSGDLRAVKGLIDAYDLVYNGFVNDVQDVQQVILILTNYSGTDKDEFLQNLRQYKMAEFESEGGDNSGLSKLTIDIPVDARKELLQETFDNIFIQGQGVNPKDLKAGTNMTGVAMKMLYGPLELKVGQMESEFRPSINKLVRFILDELNKPSDLSIKQTWIRSGIQNDVEQADIISKLSQVTSDEAIAKNNPLVSDWQDELSDRKREKEERAQTPDPFASPDPLGKNSKDNEDGEGDGEEKA